MTWVDPPLPLPRGEHPFSIGWELALQGLFTHNKETESMFDSFEPGPSDNPGADSLPLPPRSGATNPGTRPLTPEKVRHMLYGSLAALDRTIKILHSIGYADPNDWSDPIPVPPSGNLGDASPGRTAAQTPNQWMVIMTKTVFLE